MKRYPINNIDIDYDGIQFACHLSKNRIKKVAYNCAFLDDSIRLDDFKELSKYADKLSYYLKECLE